MGQKKAKSAAKEGKYAGKFVAIKSFNNKTVVASGRNPMSVRTAAINHGCKSPVVMYIPKDKMYHIF